MDKPEYKVEKYDNHEEMQKGLNKLTAQGWEPIHYAIQGTDVRRAWHYVILARPSAATT